MLIFPNEIQRALVNLCAKMFLGIEEIRNNGHVTHYINTLKVWFLWLYTLFCNHFISYQCPYSFSVQYLQYPDSWACAKGVWTSCFFFVFAIWLNLRINNLNSDKSKLQFGGISGMIRVHLNSKYRWWGILFPESRNFCVSSLVVRAEECEWFQPPVTILSSLF